MAANCPEDSARAAVPNSLILVTTSKALVPSSDALVPSSLLALPGTSTELRRSQCGHLLLCHQCLRTGRAVAVASLCHHQAFSLLAVASNLEASLLLIAMASNLEAVAFNLAPTQRSPFLLLEMAHVYDTASLLLEAMPLLLVAPCS